MSSDFVEHVDDDPLWEKYYKLVRDKIPEIILKSGKKCTYRKIYDKDEYKRALLEKLLEEVNEFIKRPNLEELANIQEIIDYLLSVYLHCSKGDLLYVKSKKRLIRGAFDNGIILEKVEK